MIPLPEGLDPITMPTWPLFITPAAIAVFCLLIWLQLRRTEKRTKKPGKEFPVEGWSPML